MALIICPECQCEISDNAKNCVHCGYPINKYKIQNYKINQKEYDLSFVLYETISKREKIKKIQDLTGCGLKESMNIVHDIYDEYDIQDSVTPQAKMTEIKDDKLHCPYCKSTNIKSISGLNRGASIAIWGIFSKKINKSFECKNCGYTW